MLFTLGILKAMAPKGFPFTGVPLSEQPLTRSPLRARGSGFVWKAPCSLQLSPPSLPPPSLAPAARPHREPCCCWELGWAPELCNSQGASSVPAGCRGSACWMLRVLDD